MSEKLEWERAFFGVDGRSRMFEGLYVTRDQFWRFFYTVSKKVSIEKGSPLSFPPVIVTWNTDTGEIPRVIFKSEIKGGGSIYTKMAMVRNPHETDTMQREIDLSEMMADERIAPDFLYGGFSEVLSSNNGLRLSAIVTQGHGTSLSDEAVRAVRATVLASDQDHQRQYFLDRAINAARFASRANWDYVGEHIREGLEPVEKGLRSLFERMIDNDVACFDLTPRNVVALDWNSEKPDIRLIDWDPKQCGSAIGVQEEANKEGLLVVMEFLFSISFFRKMSELSARNNEIRSVVPHLVLFRSDLRRLCGGEVSVESILSTAERFKEVWPTFWQASKIKCKGMDNEECLKEWIKDRDMALCDKKQIGPDGYDESRESGPSWLGRTAWKAAKVIANKAGEYWRGNEIDNRIRSILERKRKELIAERDAVLKGRSEQKSRSFTFRGEDELKHIKDLLFSLSRMGAEEKMQLLQELEKERGRRSDRG